MEPNAASEQPAASAPPPAAEPAPEPAEDDDWSAEDGVINLGVGADLALHVGESDDDDEALAAALREASFPELYAKVAGAYAEVAGACVGSNGGDEAEIQRLLREGTDVDVQTSQGWTPLMVSGSTGQPSVMRLLLRWGANVSACDKKGNNALAWTRHKVVGHGDDIVLTMPTTEEHESCAKILALAAQPWSPANHHLFPAKQRAAAVACLHAGVLLSMHRQSCAGGPPLGRAFLDAWLDDVIPAAVRRDEFSSVG